MAQAPFFLPSRGLTWIQLLVPGSSSGPGPGPVVAGHWEVSQGSEELFFSMSLPLEKKYIN